MPAFVSSKCLSVQLLTLFPPRRRRNNPANIRMQEKRRLARHHQHKASLMEEELLLDNAVIPDAPPTQPPATPPPLELPSLPPLPAAIRAVRCRLLIGVQQSAESSPQPAALERSTSPRRRRNARQRRAQARRPARRGVPTSAPAARTTQRSAACVAYGASYDDRHCVVGPPATSHMRRFITCASRAPQRGASSACQRAAAPEMALGGSKSAHQAACTERPLSERAACRRHARGTRGEACQGRLVPKRLGASAIMRPAWRIVNE